LNLHPTPKLSGCPTTVSLAKQIGYVAHFVITVVGAWSCSAASPTSQCPAAFFRGAAPAIRNPHVAAGTHEICYQAFAVLASDASRTGLWSAEHLTRDGIGAARTLGKRYGRWHADVHLSGIGRASPRDYTNSGYDRGHLSPSGDMPTPEADAETFTMANVAPQIPHLNRGSWEQAESKTRDIAVFLGETWVVTGVLFEGARVQQIGGGTLVPTSFYKALLMPGRGAAVYVATNEITPQWQVISLRALEQRSGVDVFPAVSDAVKSTVAELPMPGARRRRSH
jgi:endonuclease G